ncbi:MAG TPA: hypothetical protein VGB98_13255 [Pyrinomonadaceae bacterium]|jgi:hypothetical protein
MNVLFTALLSASLLAALAWPQAACVRPEDLRRLTGARWTGTLTYTDYSSNRRVSIPSNLNVTVRDGDSTSWVFEYEYPKEPKANGRREVTLGRDGATLDGEAVVERTSLEDGTLRVVTEKRGTDNDRAALFRFTYLIGASSFSVRKEVRRDGDDRFFERNVYSWSR